MLSDWDILTLGTFHQRVPKDKIKFNYFAPSNVKQNTTKLLYGVRCFLMYNSNKLYAKIFLRSNVLEGFQGYKSRIQG